MKIDYKTMLEEAKAKGVFNEKMMWKEIHAIEELLCIFEQEHPEKYQEFMRKMHERLFGCHYDQTFAEWRISQMFYKDKQGTVHHSPHWTDEQHKVAYDACKAHIPSTYNRFDFAVALEMLYSDNICLFRKWWPEYTEPQLEEKVVEATVNYLIDDDNPDEKIWNRFEK